LIFVSVLVRVEAFPSSPLTTSLTGFLIFFLFPLRYRLDSQQGQPDGGIMESAALAWSLVPSDVEGLTLLRRSYSSSTQTIASSGQSNSTDNANNSGDDPSSNGPSSDIGDNGDSNVGDDIDSVDMGLTGGQDGEDEGYDCHEGPPMEAICQLLLPRIPTFHGGLVLVTYSNGAVMRDGLEIDTSEVLCSVPANTTIYALEQRLNSSNVWRLRVIYEKHYGWISERMRGGSEEFMVKRLKDSTPEEIETALKLVVEAANALGISDRVLWDDQPSIAAAMEKWDDMVVSIGRGDVLEAGRRPDESFQVRFYIRV
jgi:hypothetical protein